MTAIALVFVVLPIVLIGFGIFRFRRILPTLRQPLPSELAGPVAPPVDPGETTDPSASPRDSE